MSLLDISVKNLAEIDELEARYPPTAGRPARSYTAGTWQNSRSVADRFARRVVLRKGQPRLVVAQTMKAHKNMSKGEVVAILKKKKISVDGSAANLQHRDVAL